MLILECVERKKECRGSNGVGYCPFPSLGLDTAAVLRYEGLRRARQECLRARLRICARARVGVPGKAYCDRSP